MDTLIVYITSENVRSIPANTEIIILTAHGVGAEDKSPIVTADNSHLHLVSEVAEVSSPGDAVLEMSLLCFSNKITSCQELADTSIHIPVISFAIIAQRIVEY